MVGLILLCGWLLKRFGPGQMAAGQTLKLVASRAVGAANGRNPVPIIVPCHRVVGCGHTLGGFSAGLDRKRALLRLEGVRLDGDRLLPGQLTLF